MASTCVLCDEKFATDELLRQHRSSCTYPKKGKTPNPRKDRKK